MKKKLLILGNGFDLDLGLKSRYRDFMLSDIWNKTKIGANMQTCNLLIYLENKNQIETWFDAETELLNYALEITEGKHHIQQTADRVGYKLFQTKLKEYLIKEQENFQLNSCSYAIPLMKAITDNGFFDEIYTFNYTDVYKILSKAGLSVPIKVTNMHGSLQENDEIILGIETSKSICKEYQFLFKTNSRFYRSNSLIENMEKADEIIFFGHSINGMDFPYFMDFFIKQADNTENVKKKNITIFTYDEVSDEQIRNNFREAGINLRNLMQRNNLMFIETKLLSNGDGMELKKWNELLSHLKIDSREYMRRNHEQIASMLSF